MRSIVFVIGGSFRLLIRSVKVRPGIHCVCRHRPNEPARKSKITLPRRETQQDKQALLDSYDVNHQCHNQHDGKGEK